MSSLELDSGTEPRTKMGTAFRLLDPVFGYFIWAGHFLVVYIAATLACTFGVNMADSRTRATFLAALVMVTLAAAALVGAHAWRRYQKYRAAEDKGFLLALTLGNSAIATVGILWQFIPILLVPLCV
jgi:hypothetical protein